MATLGGIHHHQASAFRSGALSTCLPRIENGTFEWHADDHLATLMGVMGHLFYSGTMVDVTLACTDGILKAHQTVLAASSPYFQTLFMSNPSNHPIVFMHNMKLSAVKSLIDFMYHGSISCSVEDIAGILDAAKVLQVRGLDSVKIPIENGLRANDRSIGGGPGGYSFPSNLVPSPFFAAANAFSPHLSSAAQVALANLLNTHSPVLPQPPPSSASQTDEVPPLPPSTRGAGTSTADVPSSCPTAGAKNRPRGRPRKQEDKSVSPSQKKNSQNPTLVKALESPIPDSLTRLATEAAVDLSTNTCVSSEFLSSLDNKPTISVSPSNIWSPMTSGVGFSSSTMIPVSVPNDSSAAPVSSSSSTAFASSPTAKVKLKRDPVPIVPGHKKRGRKPKPRVMSSAVTFVCLEEIGKGRYNSLYNQKARELALKSGWQLLVDRERRTLKGNSKDRSKGILEKSRQVLEFELPEDLLKLSEKGKFDWVHPTTGERGRIHDPRLNTECRVLSLKGLVRQTQFALKEAGKLTSGVYEVSTSGHPTTPSYCKEGVPADEGMFIKSEESDAVDDENLDVDDDVSELEDEEECDDLEEDGEDVAAELQEDDSQGFRLPQSTNFGSVTDAAADGGSKHKRKANCPIRVGNESKMIRETVQDPVIDDSTSSTVESKR